jgi:hypothetical protein
MWKQYIQAWRLWRPKFSLGIINPNDLVEHVDFGQTLVNLGHHLEKLANIPNCQSLVKSCQTLVKPLPKPFDIHVHSRTFACYPNFT